MLKLIEHSKLEYLIEHHYGQSYEILPREEVGTSQWNAYLRVDVSKGEVDNEELDIFKNTGGGMHILYNILTDMCNHNILEPGTYMIGVSW